jgi:hypothetical protein
VDCQLNELATLVQSLFTSKLSTSRLMETGHHSILVMDAKNDLQGILAIRDLR